MTHSFFPHPEHDDIAADTEPLEPLPEDGIPDGVMGGGEDITIKARTPKRRLAFLALTGFGLLAVALMCFAPHRSHQPGTQSGDPPNAAMTGRLDQAKRARAPMHGSADSLDPLNTDGATAYAPGAAPPPAEDFLDPDRIRAAANQRHLSTDSANGRGAAPATAGGQGSPDANVTDRNTVPQSSGSTSGVLYAAATGALPGMSSPALGTSIAPSTDPRLRTDTIATNSSGFSSTEMARQRAADLAREQEKRNEAERDATAKRRRAEEQRLKSEGTLLASATAVARTSASDMNAGGSVLDSAALGRSGGVNSRTATNGTMLPTAGTKYDILPGTQVSAVLTNTYVSDAQGTGAIAARLTSPLTLRDGSVLLPIGTRAFGSANANATGAGRAATVSITFTTFVTPDKVVIRTGLTGQGADPHTLALAVPGRTDNRFLSRILRGVASTAVDVLLTSPTRDQSLSTFAAPTPYDLALERGSQRASDLINGPIGDENSVRPAVVLDQNTEISMIFGLTP